MTDLPVTCPNLGAMVSTDESRVTHTFTQPDLAAADITLETGVLYFYHGGSPTVSSNVTGGPDLAIGSHIITTVIEDSVAGLSRTCRSVLIVIGKIIFDLTLIRLGDIMPPPRCF